ncbi:MAG: ABC transporter permease subunit [Candidatus Thorarchaeota archaeon]|nr:ABC transporter permease subunit [Candidatus Thorarchaeota archaeon]NIW15011.1 ABC transporter permease subunit [Candidatus Thorarchaeota archaeon]NIW53021.1 ABC transporter permease subunit [Candidatus Korarchaeota archaeon]
MKYLIRRILTSFITLLVLLSAIYLLFRLPAYLKGVSPVNVPLWALLGTKEREQLIKELRETMGLPPAGASLKTHLHYFVMYLKHMLTLDFGWSTTYPPFRITPMLLKALPYTLILLGSVTFFSIIVGVKVGVNLAKTPGSTKDQAGILTGVVLNAFPVYWLAPLMIFLFSNLLGVYPPYPSGGNSLLPGVAESPDFFYRIVGSLFMLILPMATLTLGLIGTWIYLMRNSLVRTLSEGYIFTARAKGLEEEAVLFKHALKNALIPFSTNVVLSLSTLWTWVIFAEVIFKIPGIGYMLYVASGVGPLGSFDYATAQTLTYFIALTMIIGNVLSDISYGFLDPRVRYS